MSTVPALCIRRSRTFLTPVRAFPLEHQPIVLAIVDCSSRTSPPVRGGSRFPSMCIVVPSLRHWVPFLNIDRAFLLS